MGPEYGPLPPLTGSEVWAFGLCRGNTGRVWVPFRCWHAELSHEKVPRLHMKAWRGGERAFLKSRALNTGSMDPKV